MAEVDWEARKKQKAMLTELLTRHLLTLDSIQAAGGETPPEVTNFPETSDLHRGDADACRPQGVDHTLHVVVRTSAVMHAQRLQSRAAAAAAHQCQALGTDSYVTCSN